MGFWWGFHSYQLSHEKSHGRKNPIGLFFPYGRKNPTSMFDLEMFPPFGSYGRNSPTKCFKWGFSHELVTNGVFSPICPIFVNEMEKIYPEVDLAICRSGAATCAELAAFGVPALLVPYPHAVRDHQMSNARVMQDSGAADVVAQEALSATWLRDYLAAPISRIPPAPAFLGAMVSGAVGAPLRKLGLKPGR